MAKFYATTAIPYVNAKPHLGHALEYVQADVVRRYHQLRGDEVHLISGADENALKNVQAAEKAGRTVQEFLDQNSLLFKKFYEDLGVKLDEFRRGTDQKLHWPGVQKLWERCQDAGDIYKKKYKGLYCVGCEQFYLPKDLINGQCPTHLKEPEEVEEENYFFNLSKYQNRLQALLTTGVKHLGETIMLEIVPQHRKHEVLSFIKQGLEDFSISRSNQRARGVGVPVPGDPSQKIYVWFDALAIYMTAVGWGYNKKLWERWWPTDLHVIGKDIIRFHCVYWPAILLSARLPLPKTVFSHGFITSNGQKMSKTLGNVIDPYELINKYKKCGVDALRYYLLREIPPFDDGDLTRERFDQVYHADLANGLGNLVQRIAKLMENYDIDISNFKSNDKRLFEEISSDIETFHFHIGLQQIWQRISQLDRFINDKKPWELSKNKVAKITGEMLTGGHSLSSIREIAYALLPFLPETAERIGEIFRGPKIIAPEKPLFPRLTS